MDVGFWIFALLGAVFISFELSKGVAVGPISLIRREESPVAFWVVVALHAIVLGFLLYVW